MLFANLFFVFLVFASCDAENTNAVLSQGGAIFRDTFGNIVNISFIILPKKFDSNARKTYTFHTTKVNWWKARELCEAERKEFATITSDKEHAAFLAAYKDTQSHLGRTWIGGSDLATEGRFTWATQPPAQVLFANWGPGEPNNDYLNGREDCIDVQPEEEGIWNDNQCETELAYACQKLE